MVAQGIAHIRSVDPSFDPGRFLEGARAAFEMIVGAFASGDKTRLRPLLSDEVFRLFAAAIDGVKPLIVIVDTPPGLGPLVRRTLEASQHVVVPLQCEPLALQTTPQILRAIQALLVAKRR